jgi:hypothetical protein
MTRTPRRARSFTTETSSASKNCPSSMPTTSVSGRTAASSSAADSTTPDSWRISECETM